MQRLIAIIMVGTCSIMTVACAGVKVPIRTATDVRTLKPNDEYRRSYTITFVNGDSFTVNDEDLVVQGDRIGVRFSDDEGFRYYSAEQVEEVRHHVKTRVGRGALIGLGAGVAAGVTGALLVSRSGCSNAGDPGDCSALRGLTAIGIGVVTPIIGTGIGMAIGAGIKQKKKNSVTINVAPKVYSEGNFKISGAGVGVSGRF